MLQIAAPDRISHKPLREVRVCERLVVAHADQMQIGIVDLVQPLHRLAFHRDDGIDLALAQHFERDPRRFVRVTMAEDLLTAQELAQVLESSGIPVLTLEGRGGTVAMQMELVVRFEYGAITPWVRTY